MPRMGYKKMGMLVYRDAQSTIFNSLLGLIVVVCRERRRTEEAVMVVCAWGPRRWMGEQDKTGWIQRHGLCGEEDVSL